MIIRICVFFFFQAEDGIRDSSVTGVQTCALPIWPSIVAGPIKRYEQFIPELMAATSRRISSNDAAIGLMRISLGFIKKTVADNLSQIVVFWEPHFESFERPGRWILLIALAFRILL